jgi:serine phosphatase RsbU (regulator of sigma subunit)/GAF domain-containing protein
MHTLLPRTHPSLDLQSGGLLLLLLLFLLSALTLSLLLLRRKSSSAPPDRSSNAELTSLASALHAITSAPPEIEELAEVTYVEIAGLLEADDYQLGLFNHERFRTLLWIRDGDHQANVEIPLDGEQGRIYQHLRRTRRTLQLPSHASTDSTGPPQAEALLGEQFRAGALTPLIVEGDVVGLLSVRSRKAGAFDLPDRQRLEMIAGAVSQALSAIRANTDVDDRTLQLVLIQEISRRLISLQPLSDRLNQVVHLLRETFDYDEVGMYEAGEAGLRMISWSTRRPRQDQLDEPSPPAIVERAVDAGRVVVQQQPEGAPNAGSRAVELAAPLKVEERILGVLHVRSGDRTRLPAEELAMVEMISSQSAIAVLEARNYAQQQEDAWITTVLLEVARHAAQPGDPESALQAVLQLTTLLAGAEWAVLLLPEEDDQNLHIGPSAGTRHPLYIHESTLELPAELFGLQQPLHESDHPLYVTLPELLQERLGSREALALVLSDGISLLGLLLIGGEQISERRHPLLVGIAHQVSLRLENTRLIEEAAARRSFEREVAMARGIQASLIPEFIPSHPGWQVGATWAVAREMGGDFYDFIPLPGASPRWGIVIADVADKGIPAALYMALSRTLMRSVALNETDPGKTLQRVNELLLGDSRTDMFVSLFYAVWDPSSATLAYANAGHNPPLLLRPQTRAQILSEHAMVLGVEDGVRYDTYHVELQPSQILVLYTDGVTEAINDRKEPFGVHRLENLILAAEPWRAQDVADRIEQRVKDFSGLRVISDDLTAVVLLRLRTDEQSP